MSMNITDLPNDIFLLVIENLSPIDLIICRLVSKSFHAAFTDTNLSYHVLLQHYPRSREVRNETQVDNWVEAFARVARRYHHLQTGSPRGIETFTLGKSFVVPSWARHYPVVPWQRRLQFEEKTAPFHYADTLWTYDDGLLIFPSQEKQGYILYDLAARKVFRIDLGVEESAQDKGKIVRRIRLKDGVLVVEWCEAEAYHQLNETEMVYRHFATAFDIVKVEHGNWQAVIRYVSQYQVSIHST
jgi:hypothetical protein